MKRRSEIAFENLSKAYGGIENFHKEAEEQRRRYEEAWASDAETKGRVVRSHLYVEYFFNDHLRKFFSLNKEQIDTLSFSGKIDHLKNSRSPANKLAKGLYGFNKIRNKCCHKLKSSITTSDEKRMEAVEGFGSYLRLIGTQFPNRTPIDTFEILANFLAEQLCSASNPKHSYLHNLLKAIGEDAADIYFGREGK